jgi:hypothetical protein
MVDKKEEQRAENRSQEAQHVKSIDRRGSKSIAYPASSDGTANPKEKVSQSVVRSSVGKAASRESFRNTNDHPDYKWERHFAGFQLQPECK